MYISKDQLNAISGAIAFAHWYVIDQGQKTEQTKKDFAAVHAGLRALAEVWLNDKNCNAFADAYKQPELTK
jgi:hypothetical protein